MYPPRKNESGSKSKNNQATFSSPPHKDLSKVTKLLQNAKKYEQTKEYKRDYMLEGIMNMKKKQSDHDGLGGKNRDSQISSKGSQKQQENKRDIYRRVDDIDRNRTQRGQNYKQSQQNSEREVRRLNNYKSADNLHSYQSESYRNQAPMIRQSDKPTETRIQTQPLVKHFQANSYSTIGANNRASTGNTQSNTNNTQNYSNLGAQQAIASNYSSKYETNKNIANKIEDNISSPRNISQSTYNNQQTYQTSNNYQNQGKKVQVNSFNNTRGQNTQVQSKANLTQNINNPYTNKNNNITTQNTYTENKKLTQPAKYQNNTQVNYSQIKQQGSQRLLNQFVNQYNNAKTDEEKKQLATKNFHDQSYLKKLESGELEQEQRRNIKEQMQKISSQAMQYREKYYKAENQRSILHEKCRIFQNQSHQLRKENQQLKFKLKNTQFQLQNLQNYRQHTQNEMKDLKSSKQKVYLEMSKKVNEISSQMRNKTTEISRLQRQCLDLQQQISRKKYEIQRVHGQNSKNQQNIHLLKQKQNQLNSLYQINNKIDFQFKSALQRLTILEAQNKRLRQKNQEDQKFQTDLSKYRKQIQKMSDDTKDLQMQLQQKDSIINQYKNFSYQQSENSSIKHLQAQYEKLLKQKSQISKAYEQKLLQKDKKISQLQIQQYERKNLQGPRLGGLEAGEASFQEILKQQIQQINSLKRQLTAKVGQMLHLKIQLQNMRSQLQSQKNKFRILTMQSQANQRNNQAFNDPHLRAAKNQLDFLNRRIQSLNQTIQAKRKQNQNKDQFIKKYIVTINKQLNPSVLLSNLEKILSQRL